LKQRRGRVVYVRGDAGIGKTRLVNEVRRVAEIQGFAVHRALVFDFGVGKGQDAIGAIVRGLLNLPQVADPGATAVPQFIKGAVPVEQEVFLYDLLDIAPPEECRALYDAMDNSVRSRGKRTLVADLASAACVRNPTLFVVEDVHWASPQLLDFLSAIACAVANQPGLLVMTSRREGDPIDAAWHHGCYDVPFATIDLGPLRREEAFSLAQGFMHATKHFATACIERAGGNPLFLEQLLRNAEEGSDSNIPSSIQSLVLARMDRLAPRDRLALQAAAAIGQRFELPLLRQMIAAPDYECAELIRHTLVLPDNGGFLFAHALIQEGAYASILKARRRELHLTAADWFAEKDPALHAQHLDRAQDARAAQAYLAAATSQRATYQYESSLGLVERGIEITQDEHERHAFACLKGEVLRDLGNINESIRVYRSAVAAAPDEVKRSQAQIGLAEGLRVSEGLLEAINVLDAAQEVAEQHELTAELARLHHLRGNVIFPLGKIDRCWKEHELSLEYARRLGSPEAEARALGGLADAAYAQGRMRTAFEHFKQCIELSQRHGFGRIEVANRSMLGFSRVYLNQTRQAQLDGAATVHAAELVGQRRAQLLGESIGVFSCYELGAYEEMADHLERELHLARQLGARRFEAQNLEMRARRLLQIGRRPEAAVLLRECIAICREVGMHFIGPRAHGALCLAVETVAERDAVISTGVELLGQGALGHNHLWFYRDAMEAMLVSGDAARARSFAKKLEEFAFAEPLPWSDLFVARGRVLANVRDGSIGAAVHEELLRVRALLIESGFAGFLPAVDLALEGLQGKSRTGG
jgi:tetratricopeptide (TPR) repeat protein